MLQAADPKFQELIYKMFGTLWTHDIQPTAWQMSLMQPIYKCGNREIMLFIGKPKGRSRLECMRVPLVKGKQQ